MKKHLLYSLLAVVSVISVLLMAFKPSDKTSINAGSNYILVEIYEIPTYPDKGVHIHYGNNKREVIPFKEFKTENHDDNGDIILTAINKLVAEGYEIESSAAGLTDAGMITKVFLKKK
ncbi:MAG TPA: hypothetical protein VK766_05515 [Cytophagaceae bacterium]|jgi:hypothetical protein|nr:hypothetical protein [Cytophagaceae bacterium]